MRGWQAVQTLRNPAGFVKRFYAWYVPRTLSNNPVPAYEFTLTHKRDVFTAILFNALKDDLAAAAKNSDEIVGLDFDPFLNTQDPCERHEVGKAIAKGNSYWVEVYGICSGKRSVKPDVWPEVVRANGHWRFANFHYEHQAGEYPDSADLLGILKSSGKIARNRATNLSMPTRVAAPGEAKPALHASS